MADLLKEIEAQIAGAKATTARQTVGVIREIGDGVAKIEGLADAMLNEMLDFGKGITGLALNLEETEVGAIILGDYTKLREGGEVRGNRQAAPGARRQGPAGPRGQHARPAARRQGPDRQRRRLSGREDRPRHHQAPPVSQPVQTGIMAIDAMIPIGRGQRELIIGDRSTGKTTICVDTMISQARLNRAAEAAGDTTYRPLYSIYVAIGQKQSTIARIISVLEEAGALPYTIVVVAAAVGFRRPTSTSRRLPGRPWASGSWTTAWTR